MSENSFFVDVIEDAAKRGKTTKLVASNGREANILSGYAIDYPDKIMAQISDVNNVEPTMSKLFTAAKVSAGKTSGLTINLEVTKNDGGFLVTMSPVAMFDHLFELASFIGQHDIDIDNRPAYSVNKSGSRSKVTKDQLNKGIQAMMKTFAKFNLK